MNLAHINEFPACFSMKNLISVIQTNTIEQVVNTQSKQKQNKVKVEQSFKDYSDEEDVWISIQNHKKFYKIMNSIRKVSNPNIFLYIENENNLVFTISTKSFYPIIIFKIPITKPTIQVNTSNICIEFSYKQVQQWMSISKSQNFILNLRNKDSKLMFEFITNGLINEATNFEQNIDVIRMFNEIFRPKSDDEIDIKQTNYFNLFNLMKALIIIEKPKMLDLSKIKQLQDTTKKFVVSEDSIKIIYKLNELITRDTLLDRNQDSNAVLSSHLIYYSDSLPEEMELEIDKFSTIFKSDIKIVETTDNIYYVLCNWMENNYMLIKIITDHKIEDKIDSDLLFKDIFTNGTNMIFCYYCH